MCVASSAFVPFTKAIDGPGRSQPSCPRAGWISMLLLKWLQEQCNDPAAGAVQPHVWSSSNVMEPSSSGSSLRRKWYRSAALSIAESGVPSSCWTYLPPSRVDQHVAIEMAAGAVQPPGSRTY